MHNYRGEGGREGGREEMKPIEPETVIMTVPSARDEDGNEALCLRDLVRSSRCVQV